MTSHPNRPQASPTVQVENARTIITQWRFAPEAETGWHRHAHDYAVVPLSTGRLRIVGKDGESFAELVAGQTYFRQAGVEHNGINASGGEFTFVEIEYR